MSSIFEEFKEELKLKIFETSFIESFILTYGKELFGDIPIDINQANRYNQNAKLKFFKVLINLFWVFFADMLILYFYNQHKLTFFLYVHILTVPTVRIYFI